MTKTEHVRKLRENLKGDILVFTNSISAGGQLNINDESEVELLDNLICGQKQTDLCFIDRTTAYQAVAIVLSKMAPAIADFVESKSDDITYVDFDLSDYCPIVGKGFHMVNQKIVHVATTSTGIMLGHDDSEIGFHIISAFPVINDNFKTLNTNCVSILEQTETYLSNHVSKLWRLAARATCGDPMLQEFCIQYKPESENHSEQLIISHKNTGDSLTVESVTLSINANNAILKSFAATDLEIITEDDMYYRSVNKKYRSFASVTERDPSLVRFTMFVIEQLNALKSIRRKIIIQETPPDETTSESNDEETDSEEEPSDEHTEPSKPVPRYSEIPTGPVKELADHKLFPAQNYNENGDTAVDYTNVPTPASKNIVRRGPTRPSTKPFGLKDIT